MIEDDKLLNKRTAKDLDSFHLTEALQHILKKSIEPEVREIDTPVIIRHQVEFEDKQKSEGLTNCKDNELRAQFAALKSFVMSEIYDVKADIEKLSNPETDGRYVSQSLEREVMYLNEENKNKSLIIQTLLENQKLLLRDGTKNATQEHNFNLLEKKAENVVTEIPKDMEFQIPKRTVKRNILNSINNNYNKNNFLSPNRYDNLRNYETEVAERNLVEQICENVNQLNSTRKTVPGNTSYATITKKGKNVTVFGDSIVGRINKKEINKFTKANVFIKSFSGATVKDMHTYVEPTLERKICDTVIIHVGTNDIPDKQKSTKDISDSIINIGMKCRDRGVNSIIISSITRRKRNINLQRRINEVNDFLSAKCLEKDFTFIDNRNIKDDDIRNDFLHLGYSGTCKLADNFIDSINNVCLF